MINRLRRPALSGVLAAVVVSSCGSSSPTNTGTTTAAHAARRTAAAARPSADGVPLPSRATRVVSLSEAATEDLFAAGAGGQVVAADEYSVYPAGAPKTKLNPFSPNVEAIAKYRPDLVVISQNAGHIETQLGELRIPVIYAPAPANLNGAYAQMRELGAVTGHAAQAGAVVGRLKARVARIVASVPRRTRPLTVYHELDQTLYSASSKTFVGQVYALLGFRNIADRATKAGVYPQLSSEYVTASNPSLVVLADTVCCGQTAAKVAARPGWGNLTAVRDHHVLGVDDTVASEWGPRIVDFLAQVAGEARAIEAGK
jgi:iron complex transport system substrate-binding protein